MRRILTLAIILCAALALREAQSQRINLPPVSRVTLPNGIRVILMEYRRAPSFTIRAQFPGGASRDPKGKAGLAGLTAELLRKGTQKRTAQQIAEEIDFLGGSLGGAADDDRLAVSLSVLSRDSSAGLDLFADVIRRPTFPQEELERERQLLVAALEAMPEDPSSIAARVADQVAFPDHPYGTSPTITSVKAITRADVQQHYSRWMSPDMMTLVAVGDFKAQVMLTALRTRFGDWPKAERFSVVNAVVTANPRKMVLIDKPDAVQTQARWVRQAIPRNHPDYYTAQLAETILGGGFTSRLVEEIRVNRGLTYGIGSSFDTALHGGSFGVSTFTKVETTKALIDAVNSVLRQASRKGLTAAEIQKGKQYIAGIFAIQVQTPESIASQLSDMAFFNLPNDYLQTYIQKIREVTAQDLNRVSRSYFAPERLSIVLVAPAKMAGPQLTRIGTFETRTIDSVVK